MEKDLHSLLTYSIIYTERNKGQKEYPMKAPIEYQRKMKAIHPDITQEEIEHNFRIKKALDNDEVQAAVEDYVFWREATEGVK